MKSGFVYFVQALENRRIKIGFTERSPIERMREFQTGTSERLALLASTTGDKIDERDLHLRFSGARVVGEWFEPVDALHGFIDGIKFSQGREDERDREARRAAESAAKFRAYRMEQDQRRAAAAASPPLSQEELQKRADELLAAIQPPSAMNISCSPVRRRY